MNENIVEEQLKNLLYNIAWLRRKSGLSKKTMAKLLGVGIGRISKIEKGELPPKLSLEALINIFYIFRVDPSELSKRRLGGMRNKYDFRQKSKTA